jgi:hypothetical protein
VIASTGLNVSVTVFDPPGFTEPLVGLAVTTASPVLISVQLIRLFPVLAIVNVLVFDVPTVSLPKARLPLSSMIRVGAALESGAGVAVAVAVAATVGTATGAAVGRGVGLNTFDPPESHPTRNRAIPASATPRSVDDTRWIRRRRSR